MPEPTDPMEQLVRSLKDDLDCSRAQVSSLEAELVAVRSRVDSVRALTQSSTAVITQSPSDCNYLCDDGPCTCSGLRIPIAWDLDPARLLAALGEVPQ